MFIIVSKSILSKGGEEVAVRMINVWLKVIGIMGTGHHPCKETSPLIVSNDSLINNWDGCVIAIEFSMANFFTLASTSLVWGLITGACKIVHN